jgi:ribosomal protein L37AE/L43A
LSILNVQKQAPTDAEIQAELEKAALEDAEIEEFAKPVAQEAQKTKQDAPESKKSPSKDIPASERWYCKECGDTFAAPAGLNKDMCPKLHKGIIDRWAKADKK